MTSIQIFAISFTCSSMDMQLVLLPSTCFCQVRQPYVMLVHYDNSPQPLFDSKLCLMLSFISRLFESVQFPLFIMADDITVSCQMELKQILRGTFVFSFNILTKLLVILFERIVNKHRLSSDICLLVLSYVDSCSSQLGRCGWGPKQPATHVLLA
jgi:hypothetical protein